MLGSTGGSPVPSHTLLALRGLIQGCFSSHQPLRWLPGHPLCINTLDFYGPWVAWALTISSSHGRKRGWDTKATAKPGRPEARKAGTPHTHTPVSSRNPMSLEPFRLLHRFHAIWAPALASRASPLFLPHPPWLMGPPGGLSAWVLTFLLLLRTMLQTSCLGA